MPSFNTLELATTLEWPRNGATEGANVFIEVRLLTDGTIAIGIGEKCAEVELFRQIDGIS